MMPAWHFAATAAHAAAVLFMVLPARKPLTQTLTAAKGVSRLPGRVLQLLPRRWQVCLALSSWPRSNLRFLHAAPSVKQEAVPRMSWRL